MTTLLDEVLELEHVGWRSLCDGTGSEVYGRLMTADSRMVLAGGMVMTRDDVTESLRHAPPWDGYTIADPAATTIGSDACLLVYIGTGRRTDGDDFTAVMASVYVRHGGEWKLAHYQQTPTN